MNVFDWPKLTTYPKRFDNHKDWLPILKNNLWFKCDVEEQSTMIS